MHVQVSKETDHYPYNIAFSIWSDNAVLQSSEQFLPLSICSALCLSR